jgi:hypothetical protein
MVRKGRKRVVLSKRVSVGRGRQVSWITDRLSSNKWPTDHLSVRWQVTVPEGYRQVTWRLLIGGKGHSEGACHERMGGKD